MTAHAFATHLIFGFFIALISAALTRVMITINIADVPNERSSHDAPKPKSGGIAVATAFFAGIVTLFVVSDTIGLPDLGFGAFVGLSGFLVLVALADDLFELPAWAKFAPQLIVAAGFAVFVAHVERMWLPAIGYVELGWFGYAGTMLWILFFMNAFNFMDGIDGLAGGAALIGGTFLAAIAFMADAFFVYLASICLVGAALGFYFFNFPRSRIFLGDGSQVIGFVFAALAVIGSTADYGHASIYVVPMIFFCFLYDVVVARLHRFWRRESFFDAHREHLYQLLTRLGLSHVEVSFIYYGLLVFGGIGAILVQLGTPGQRLGLIAAYLVPFSIFAWVVYREADKKRLFSKEARGVAE